MAREAEEGVAVSTTFRNSDGRYMAIWHPSHKALANLWRTRVPELGACYRRRGPERRIDNASETLTRIQDEVQLHGSRFALLNSGRCCNSVRSV